MHSSIKAVEVLGIRIAKLTVEEALDELVRLHDQELPAVVAYANAHTLNVAVQDDAFRQILQRADLVLNDGAGLALAARIHGDHFPANLNGTDLTPRVLDVAAREGWPVYFLGAKPGIAAKAATTLAARIPGLRVAGARDGYFDREALPHVLEEIRASKASLLLVAMGNPIQEKWLNAHLASTGARLGMAVGAFFDFTAGEVPRAPAWFRHAGVEWMYRLSLEPKRLWKRYVLGNPAFLGRVVAERLRRLR